MGLTANKKAFIKWAREYNEHRYTESTIRTYANTLERLGTIINVDFCVNFFDIKTKEKFFEIKSKIEAKDGWVEFNRNYQHGVISAAIGLYYKYLMAISEDIWWPSKEDFDPKLSQEDWKKFIVEVEKPKYPACVRMLKAMMELGGEATCKELSIKYGGHPSVYAACAMNIGRHVKSFYGLPACMDGNQERYYPFPFLGKQSGRGDDNYIYKIRPELYEALNEIDLSDISPYYVNEHSVGVFDSWEIVDEMTAVKTCDKSFYAYNGSGVPKELCWFFDAEDIPAGQGKTIKLIFEEKEYTGKLSNDTTDRRRIQIRWNRDLTKDLEYYKTDGAKAQFVKVKEGVYQLDMIATLFDVDKFNGILLAYKEAIKNGWLEKEKYKWEAIKCFQDNWDVDAFDFENMWVKATSKTYNLLASMNNFPRGMIQEFVKKDKECVRQMFKNLFDDTKGVVDRIRDFINSAEALRVKYGEKDWKHHYQTVNAVSTYLWLKYPDKYYIYKYQDCRKATEKMGCPFSIRKGETMDNVLRTIKLSDAIAEIFKKDEELIMIREKNIDKECYGDEQFKTFAIDFIYYASRGYNEDEDKKGGETKMTIKEIIQNIKSYIAAKGFNYEGNLIENFYLSLKSKPFVILAGTSGTGKTKLVKLFAEAICAEMKLVPVRPDWSDSSDLFGHVDLAGNFKPGAIIDFVKQAELNKNKPYFLCLDEMNLARVEYYLSDFLSIIETRDRVNGEIITDSLVSEEYYQNERAKDKYGKLIIPENLYIIGTVKMDETTFPFSKKVLDRANTIEFSFVNLMSKEQVGLSASALQLDNSFLKTKYLYFNEIEDKEFKSDICFKLEELNEALRKANLHVGYRVRDEISFYMINNKECELLEENAAFDNEIMQKILPRIQGSSGAIKQLLCDLFVLCAGDYSGFTGSSIYEQMSSYIAMKDCKYPNTANKIVFMMRRYEEDGFTSYWL